MTPLSIAELAGINLPLYPRSIADAGDAAFFLAWTPAGKRLGVTAPAASPILSTFEGEPLDWRGSSLLLCPLTHRNAAALRRALAWLRPAPLGLAASAGCGDRLGLATPGHVRAAELVPGIAMIFAQQSIREMARTGRTPDEVMDDATWGIFQEGWRERVGADADHLKTPEDIDRCAAAGFTFFTIDPGAHVDPTADTDDEATLRNKYAALPWERLASTPASLASAYRNATFDLGGRGLTLDEPALYRAAVKYGAAVAHVAGMYHHLASVMAGRPFELEVSVDETETPTSHAEHIFVATELRRLGVRWVSLAPRYVGRFEKGVDYIGDVRAFEADFAGHAAIARSLGPYKLSLHSGSDKFSIYPIAAEQARGLIHLKTAGTSYLEALRATAAFDPALFREIFAFARGCYETDRASYHVSAELGRVPEPDRLSDEELPGLLDQFDARQVLHVTFGSALTSGQGYGPQLKAGLAGHEETHYDALEHHFVRHLAPLAGR
jgi:tagaturonate epimerase